MNNAVENILNSYDNYPVILGVFLFCFYAIVAPPIIKFLFNKKNK
tara:strand:+ start:688 stop:822 length:135 start_codon:yes stop_codon:yes gene_type:complete